MVVWVLCRTPAHLSTVNVSQLPLKRASFHCPQASWLSMGVTPSCRLMCAVDALRMRLRPSRTFHEAWVYAWVAAEYGQGRSAQRDPDKGLSQQVSMNIGFLKCFLSNPILTWKLCCRVAPPPPKKKNPKELVGCEIK